MKIKLLSILLLGAVLISACGGKDTPEQAPEPAAVEAQPAVEEVAPETAPVESAAEAPQPAAQESTSGMMTYTAPEDLFKLQVPNGWNYTMDTDAIENTTVETFTAPDGNAFVQIVINSLVLHFKLFHTFRIIFHSKSSS